MVQDLSLLFVARINITRQRVKECKLVELELEVDTQDLLQLLIKFSRHDLGEDRVSDSGIECPTS